MEVAPRYTLILLAQRRISLFFPSKFRSLNCLLIYMQNWALVRSHLKWVMKDFIHLKKMFEILCVIPCPVKLDGYLCVLDEKNNDLDAMLHFKRTLNNVKKTWAPCEQKRTGAKRETKLNTLSASSCVLLTKLFIRIWMFNELCIVHPTVFFCHN